MTTQEPSGPEGLSEEAREVLRRAHVRLRKASQELEAVLAPRSLRGRWEPVVAPPEVVDAVRADLSASYRELVRLHHQLLGWDPPSEPAEGQGPT